MLAAFFGPPYRDWWLSTVEEGSFTSPWDDHWLVSKSAAHAFSRGLVKLDRMQPSMVEYEVRQWPIGPASPIEIDGEVALLGDRSRAGITKVDPRFVGTHARLSRSIQYIELSKKLAKRERASKTGWQPSKIISNFWRRVTPLAQPFLATALAVWLRVPARVRIVAYRTLRRAAQCFIPPDCHTVQRLPFGLYLKCAAYPASLRNEVNAMRLVRQYTSISIPRPLDYVEGPVQKEQDKNLGPDFQEERAEAYLLMNRIPGVPLAYSYELLADSDMAEMTAQLQDYVRQLRAMPKTVNPDMAICNTLGGACKDPRVRFGSSVGPFIDEAGFSAPLRSSEDPARRGHEIYFTHADLNPRNIMVEEATEGQGWRVSGIVD